MDRSTARLAPYALAAAIALPLAGWAGDVSAEIFTCKDPNGRVLTSDRPIPECAGTGMRELRTDGSTRREIAPPPTREQREAREREEAAQKLAEAARQRELQRDRALMLIYPSMADLTAARRRQIDLINTEITASHKRMNELHGHLKQAQAALAAAADDAGRATQDRNIKNYAQQILNEDAVVLRKREELTLVNKRFDEDADRLARALGPQAPAMTAAAPSR